MKYREYYKNIWRAIKSSLGRFIAIMAIIALGVGFFVGVKVTKSSMIETGNRYVIEHNMFDFKFVSTLGFTHEEVDEIEKAEGVSQVEGSITCDFFSKDNKGNSVIFKAHSMPQEINILRLVEGRLPESGKECVGDKEHFSREDVGREIIVSSENSEETIDSFEYSSFKLVGLVDSPIYMNRSERGTASIGDGSVKAYVFLPKDAFTSEYYTEVYVTCQEQGYIYSDEYNNNIKKARPAIEEVAKQCGINRHEDILTEATAQIDSGQKELLEGKQKLQDGRDRLNANREKTYAQLNSAKKTLDNNRDSIERAEAELTAQRDDLLAQIESLERAQQAAQGAYNNALNMSDNDPAKAETLARTYGQLQEVTTALESAISALSQIDAALEVLPAQRAQLAAGYEEYYSGRAKADEEFAKAEDELRKAEAQLARGERELEQAKRDLKELKNPKLYTQLREDNLGYDSFNSNSDIVDSIAKVFPVFFFLIAALVCSTTMSRMIEEERTQIGTLRAIGYSRRRIIGKYLIYSGAAALIGSISGFLLGSKFFPLAIWMGYSMIFDFSPLVYYFSLPLAIISVLVALLCSAGTTCLAASRQLKEMPAEILRPKAPKAGKRVLIERISPLWNRLRFLHKVAIRNIFRYKKRMVMMIMGIAGCTALVLAGFGIFDSVAGMADHQYDEIEKYDVTVQFDEVLTDKKTDEFIAAVNEPDGEGEISIMVPIERISVNAKSEDKIRSCDLMVTDKYSDLQKVVNFREKTTDGSKLTYPKEGEALINNKLAELMKVEKGDMLTIEYDDTKTAELRVSGVYRNYVGNYIYINEETYDTAMNKIYEPRQAFVKLSEGDSGDLIKRINEDKNVLGIHLNEDTRKNIDNMMVSLNYIVWLVVACAGALAFIVLFNLGNINITERTREIATIKVLGFHSKETGAYVFRESIVLIIMGIIIGLPLGYALHKFIMKQIIVDMIAFNESVEPISYLYSTLMVILFAVFTDLVLRRKLRRINMAEALKSIE